MKEPGRIMWLFVLLCVIAATGTGCIWQKSAEQEMTSIQRKKRASISIANTVYDFGDIIQGETPVATFVFRNAGDDVLNINQGVTDDKDITTVVSHKSLNPGEEGSIKATLDSTRLYGKVVRHITVITNDEEQPEVLFKVMARVQPNIALEPPFIFVGQVPKGGSFSGKARLRGKLVDEGKLKNLTINKSSPSIEARIQHQTVKDENVAFLEFVLLPEMKAGSFRETLTLISEDPPSQAQLLLFGQKLGDIRFTPDKLELFPRKGMKADSRSILLECDKPFNITKVEDLSGRLELSIKVINEGRKYELTAKVKNPREGSFLGVVKVYTDLEEHSLIHIPVIGGDI
jgi:hypothetical protein